MSVMQFIITIGLLMSYIHSLKPIYGLLLFQGIQTTLYNFLSFDLSDSNNYLVDNILMTSTASIFVTFNSYLFCRLFDNMWLKAIVSVCTMVIIQISIFMSNYNWGFYRSFDILFLGMYIVIGNSLVFVFGYI